MPHYKKTAPARAALKNKTQHHYRKKHLGFQATNHAVFNDLNLLPLFLWGDRQLENLCLTQAEQHLVRRFRINPHYARTIAPFIGLGVSHA